MQLANGAHRKPAKGGEIKLFSILNTSVPSKGGKKEIRGADFQPRFVEAWPFRIIASVLSHLYIMLVEYFYMYVSWWSWFDVATDTVLQTIWISPSTI